MAGQPAGVPGRPRHGPHAVKMSALTLAALALAWGAWQAGVWAQGLLGLEWLGLVFPGVAVALALGVMSRVLGEAH